ncbi:hypothetical protein [Paenibacillus wynnii]|uniref:hypothetical protein n=1 Tax=Paenibacillus wynnii TaxID=268407 RepID=UPI002791A6CE|nr:hypothetical protein [Paenibacillus wynnii]MDQ0193280.1 hypothetical protein [Paenibacillus wynnii]
MKGKLNKNLFLLILCSIIFSFGLSSNQSEALYHKIGINNYYGSLLLDVVINFLLALVVVKVVSRLKFFKQYRTFIMNHFSLRTGKYISCIVYLLSLFLLLLPIVLLIEPDYVVDFLVYHLLFASIFSIDNFMNSETNQEYK